MYYRTAHILGNTQVLKSHLLIFSWMFVGYPVSGVPTFFDPNPPESTFFLYFAGHILLLVRVAGGSRTSQAFRQQWLSPISPRAWCGSSPTWAPTRRRSPSARGLAWRPSARGRSGWWPRHRWGIRWAVGHAWWTTLWLPGSWILTRVMGFVSPWLFSYSSFWIILVPVYKG